MGENLQLETRGDIVWVVIDRPEDRNSINTDVMADLARILGDLERRKPRPRAVVFEGSGDTYFVGGADGVEMMQLGMEGARRFSTRIQGLFDRIEASPLITVAAISGLCFGGGFELALACDLRVATKTSRIGLPEVKVGLIPGGGGTQRLPRLVGLGQAMRMILSGKLYSGDEALELGLVHETCVRDDLDATVKELLRPILRNPHHALTLAKQALHAGSDSSFSAGLTVESERFAQCFEYEFFRALMERQLHEGTLTTTEDVSRLTTSEEVRP